jgi:serine/threonine protein phosphatase PrpC
MAKQAAFSPALKLSFPAGQGLNEDQAICLKHADIRLLAAFDGCGGVGGRRYPQHDNHTGAYIAAGLYADCLTEWFKSNAYDLPRGNIASDLTTLFAQAAREYNARYLDFEPSAVTGSMVRTLPSTAAIALIFGRDAALYWAGNTRGYLLTDRGLVQLTADDLAAQCDAFESLYLDVPISNYLCADQSFVLHERTIRLPEKGILILATDGAFHALPTPIHFEALLLDMLTKAATPKQWKKLLRETLEERAGDDVTLLLQPFGFETQDEMKLHFDKRRRHVRQAYILPAEQAEREGMTALRALWDMYCRE